jgi:hypothetical protein
MRSFLKVAVACGGAALATAAWAGEPEDLLGFSLDAGRGRLTLEVVSTGCTAKGDFRFERQGEVLTVVRQARDACKAMPSRARLEFTLAEAGVDVRTPLRLANRFVADELSANLRAAPGK